jgi:hypothetical protein
METCSRVDEANWFNDFLFLPSSPIVDPARWISLRLSDWLDMSQTTSPSNSSFDRLSIIKEVFAKFEFDMCNLFRWDIQLE